MPSIELDGLEVSVYRSEIDGSLIVDITGPEGRDQEPDGSPALRVWLNESRLYENPLKGEPQLIAIVGNLSDGFKTVGPFDNHDEVSAYSMESPTGTCQPSLYPNGAMERMSRRGDISDET